MCIHMCAHACEGLRLISEVFLNNSQFLFLETESFIKYEAHRFG